ncbi:phospholipase D family protein [Comamonas testosteroni]|uniref:phospholipase D family nuclease n=1 Tax=Comamonas testosteroni TaxID=285 RepID=UPI001E5476F2|nr:phospholipase D family protein [Comamonas testosteroni]
MTIYRIAGVPKVTNTCERTHCWQPAMSLNSPLTSVVAKVLGMTIFRKLALATLLSTPVWVQAEPNVRVGFSPEESAQKLVLETIAGAKHDIQILAYAFQAPDIMQALAAARNRGVKVRVVVDKRRNKGKTSKKAMDFAISNGVELRINDHFHIHHDKVIIVDGSAVETGSLNFAPSAETANSENVVVIRDMPGVAKQYIAHWQSRWDLGKPYPPID